MAQVTVYCTTASDLASRIKDGYAPTVAETSILDAAIVSACGLIDGLTHRFFGTTADATVKYFTARDALLLKVDDLVSVSSIATDEDGDGTYERTWSTSDYHLLPNNAAGELPARPYTRIAVSFNTGSQKYTFPPGTKRVKVTGVWGWPAVPGVVKSVAILEALRGRKQEESPSGVIANTALGTFTVLPDLHPTSRRRLAPFIRMERPDR